MPNRNVHKLCGTVIGAVVAVEYGSYKEQDFANAWKFMLGGAVSGFLTSTLADKFDPPTSPNHRNWGHSVVLNGGIAFMMYEPTREFLQYLVDKAREYDNRQENFKAMICRLAFGFLVGASSGYASHLLTDSVTPKGLPLVC